MSHDINPILDSDSYKFSHSEQYPKGTEFVYSYFESRGGLYDTTTFFGLQYILKTLLSTPITTAMVDEAQAIAIPHMGHFNRKGWDRLVEKWGGLLPIEIKAVPEGTTVPNRNVLMTVVNTDPEFFWLTNFLETALVRVWYPSTVATLSREGKRIIGSYLEQTSGSREGLEFKLHDFGARGVSSYEQAMIGGMAHLINFMGTDTIPAIVGHQKYYSEYMAGFSIPASEHSTITSWGRDNEVDAFRNMLEKYPTGLVACVSDSYSITTAVESLWGQELRTEVLGRDGVLVVRPDSGDPQTMVMKVLNGLGNAFGYTMNAQGYKVLNDHVRVIQGDGVDNTAIEAIVTKMAMDGWSIENIAFGSGGGLLQKMDRDTQKFAFKCSAICVNGVWRDVYKQPEGEGEWKQSKKGQMGLFQTVSNGHYQTLRTEKHFLHTAELRTENLLKTVYLNGVIIKDQTLTEIRERANIDANDWKMVTKENNKCWRE